MSHPRVAQLRFTRREWRRGLKGVSADIATQHLGRMNCISWIVGHMAWHEQRYWLDRAQGIVLFPSLNELCAYGAPMSTLPLADVLDMWEKVTVAADPYLNSLTTELLQSPLLLNGESVGQSVGSAMQRVTYHYWYHTGEVQAIRQVLGQRRLPQYVGAIEAQAPYRPE